METGKARRSWTFITLAAAATAVVSLGAAAHPPGGGWGYGYGPGCGMAAGAFGGYGMGPGMMGSYGGMMGYGPGPMGFGRGFGMMGEFGPLAALDLDEEQQRKIREIRSEQRRAQWELAGKMLEEQTQLEEVFSEEKPDPKKAGEIYARIAKLQQQILEAQLSARNRIRDTLTAEQRERLEQWWGGGFGPGPYGRQGPGRIYGPGMMRR
ncbi:MAG TPA: Spy/CpxP family protein refolding chaperone [Burkholderiales bacterium]